MSDMRRLLEAVDRANEGSMKAAEKHSTGPKFPGYWRGRDPASKAKSRMVGSNESVIKELSQEAAERGLEWQLTEAYEQFKMAEASEEDVAFDELIRRLEQKARAAQQGTPRTVWDPRTRKYKVVYDKPMGDEEKLKEYSNAQSPSQQSTNPNQQATSTGATQTFSTGKPTDQKTTAQPDPKQAAADAAAEVATDKNLAALRSTGTIPDTAEQALGNIKAGKPLNTTQLRQVQALARQVGDLLGTQQGAYVANLIKKQEQKSQTQQTNPNNHELRNNMYVTDFFENAAEDPNSTKVTNKGEGIQEAKGLLKRVRVIQGSHRGKEGTIRQIRHGAFKGAPRRYDVDLDDGGQANNLPGTALRLIREGVAESKGKLTYTPEPTEYGVFPDSKNEFVKTFLSKDLALAHIKKFGGKLVVLDQYGRRMKQGVAKGTRDTVTFAADGKATEVDGERGMAESSQENQYLVTCDHYGTNREVPLYTKSYRVRANSEDEAIETIRNLVGGRNHRAEQIMAEDLDIAAMHQGDPVKITGQVRYQGKKGKFVDWSPSGKFVIVDLGKNGIRSFHASDVSIIRKGVAEGDEAHNPGESLQKFAVGDWVIIDPNKIAGHDSSGMKGQITKIYADSNGKETAIVNVFPNNSQSSTQDKMNLQGRGIGLKGAEIHVGTKAQTSGIDITVPTSLLKKISDFEREKEINRRLLIARPDLDRELPKNAQFATIINKNPNIYYYFADKLHLLISDDNLVDKVIGTTNHEYMTFDYNFEKYLKKNTKYPNWQQLNSPLTVNTNLRFGNWVAQQNVTEDSKNKGVAEAEDKLASPSRRGFLKKAGAAAVNVATPGGVVGKALKAIGTPDAQISQFTPLLMATIKLGNKLLDDEDEVPKIRVKDLKNSENLEKIRDLLKDGQTVSFWSDDDTLDYKTSGKSIPYMMFNSGFGEQTNIVFQAKNGEFQDISLYYDSSSHGKNPYWIEPGAGTIPNDHYELINDFLSKIDQDPSDDKFWNTIVDIAAFGRSAVPGAGPGANIAKDVAKQAVKTGAGAAARSTIGASSPAIGAVSPAVASIIDRVINHVFKAPARKPQAQAQAQTEPLALPAPKVDVNDILYKISNKLGRGLYPEEVQMIRDGVEQELQSRQGAGDDQQGVTESYDHRNTQTIVERAISRNIANQRRDLIQKHGFDKVMEAINHQAKRAARSSMLEEIGAREVRAWVKDIERRLG